MNPKEMEQIYKCYSLNYKNLNCLSCEMNFLCEAWKNRDGANPLTMRMINPDMPKNTTFDKEAVVRQVA